MVHVFSGRAPQVAGQRQTHTPFSSHLQRRLGCAAFSKEMSRAGAAWIQELSLDSASQVCLSDIFPNMDSPICHSRAVLDLTLGSWRWKEGKQAPLTDVGFLLLKSRLVSLAFSIQHTSPRYSLQGLERERIFQGPRCPFPQVLILQFAATYQKVQRLLKSHVVLYAFFKALEGQTPLY